jgi:cytoplasmic iron level regulating protein YaaA (DUF328/UPF0246 family)
MARYIVEHQLTKVSQLQDFDVEGYAWDESASSAGKLVYRRKQAA